MNLNNLHDLYVEQLRDLYSAETQLLDALPKMAFAASSDELRDAFNEHLNETRGHVERLNDIFADIGVSPLGERCPAMEGLIREAEEMIAKQADPIVRDAGLIAAAQRVEHYEIAGYGTVVTFAKNLDLDNHADSLQNTLDEESSADKKLTRIATGGLFNKGINKKAV